METVKIVQLCVSAVTCIAVWWLVFRQFRAMRKLKAENTIKRIEVALDDPGRFATED